jgi:hypothetical protein
MNSKTRVLRACAITGITGLFVLILYAMAIPFYTPAPNKEFYVSAWECFYWYNYGVIDSNYDWRKMKPAVGDKLSSFLKENKKYRRTKTYFYIMMMNDICHGGSGVLLESVFPVIDEPEGKYRAVARAFDIDVKLEMIENDIAVDTRYIRSRMEKEYEGS